MIQIQHLLQPGDLVFDIGAHTGSKTDAFLAIGCSVVCVEPQPECVDILMNKYKGNNKVKIIETGVSNVAGTEEMSICDGASVISTFTPHWKKGRFSGYNWNRTIKVQMITLDGLIDYYGLPQYCKIDTEGFELMVLDGLNHKIPIVSFEFTGEFFHDAVACMDRLTSIGFARFNFCLGENWVMDLREWATMDQVTKRITELKVKDPLIWGDIYAN